MLGYMKCYMLGYMQVTDIPTYIKNKHFLHNTPAFFPGCSVSDAPPLEAGKEIPSGGVAGSPGRGRPRPSTVERRPSSTATVERADAPTGVELFPTAGKIQDVEVDRDRRGDRGDRRGQRAGVNASTVDRDVERLGDRAGGGA